jgi:soluble lytic murein transglycosylase-like protein
MKSLIKQESGFGHFRASGAIKTSGAGAIGICQLMPETARGLGVNPYDLEENIKGGAMYLSNALAHYNGDKIKAVASYNAGMGAVDKYNGIPPYNETRHYVRAVMGNYAVYKGRL